MVDNATHVVTLKGHKTENGILKLNIRDSARDPNNSSEIWIEKNNSPNNQMNLATDMCIYFELSWNTLTVLKASMPLATWDLTVGPGESSSSFWFQNIFYFFSQTTRSLRPPGQGHVRSPQITANLLGEFRFLKAQAQERSIISALTIGFFDIFFISLKTTTFLIVTTHVHLFPTLNYWWGK